MCVVTIVDTNSLDLLTAKKGSRDDEFRAWIAKRHGIIVIGRDGKYFAEIRKNVAFMELLKEYDSGGQLRKISKEQLAVAGKEISEIKKETKLRSDDPHILSLALASDAQILLSKDKNLRTDFKDRKILQNVGGKKRSLYPIGGKEKIRKDFLNHRRCSNRRQK